MSISGLLTESQTKAIKKESLYQPTNVLDARPNGDVLVLIGQYRYIVDASGHLFKETQRSHS